MLNKKLLITEIIGFVFCIIMSFVFHFAFEWLNNAPSIAWLFATNESVWEHSKIIFYPFFIFSIVEYFIIKPDIKVYLTAKSIPLIFCIPLMLVIYFTYSGIIGTNYLAIDIIMTILIIFAMSLVSYKMINSGYFAKYYYIYAMLAISIFAFIIIFTYFPPHINLFYDKTKNMYGIPIFK